ncbi:MAG: L,D-transpeptidase family protein [Alphaproteobacteria bacterium]|jgi:murein L,D-transpeptidase YcbB/YkuD|nr:L,D-transpeptidase family protein [Alphaproteobacteria bacterium]
MIHAISWCLPGRLVVAILLGLALSFGAADRARADGVEQQLELRFDDALKSRPKGLDGDEFEALREFYLARGFKPLWIGSDGANASARSLAKILVEADADGLFPTDYNAQIIAKGLAADGAAAEADLEFSLSRALIRYGSDLSAGRVDPARVDKELHIYPSAVPAAELLAAAADPGADLVQYLATLAPQSKEYRRLKGALADYRAIAARGGWEAVPPGETLKPGMRDRRIALLRRRLKASGDIAVEAAEPEHYDKALEAAVRHFQYRHGLTVDGAVGKKSLAALNVPVTARIEQILLNMERRRWMPDDLGEAYVFVNMADFVLKVVKGPKTVLDTRVVVGKPYHRTPVFSDKMRYIVLNPYWTIPPSIARNEMLPKLRKNPNYLKERNIRVFADWNASARELGSTAIDWHSVKRRSFPYKLRQDAGKGNALGNLKFMFPNRFNVYLHDTSARQLFKKTVRSFSHGCIRVENPTYLATVLLSDQEDWSKERLEQVIAGKKRRVVNFEKPIPVHLTYLTAWVNKDGSVHFRADIYERDKRLQKALDRLQRST